MGRNKRAIRSDHDIAWDARVRANFAVRLRAALDQHPELDSVPALAARADLPESTLYAYLRDPSNTSSREPGLTVLLRLASALDLQSLDQLVGRVEDPAYLQLRLDIDAST
ncbi:MAG: hypothetical protein R2707_16475 [Acidimicrobiales bacterium]